MSHMVRIARPISSEAFEDPLEALGSLSRAGIIGYLRTNGPAGRTEIAQGLGLGVDNVKKILYSLTSAGLLIADPPLDKARRGQRVTYRVNNTAVTELYLQFGQAIGEL